MHSTPIQSACGAPDDPHALTRATCLRLLSQGGQGRVAATMRAIPVVIPVRFTLEGDHIAFTPAQGEGRAEAVDSRVVAFETDQLGDDGRTVWDVHVTGIPAAIIDDSVTARFRLSTEVMSGWGTDV